MERIIQKIATLSDALKTLADSIALFDECTASYENSPTERNEVFFLGMRDSMIQRFEYCTDLFWKVIKIYLEDVEKIDLAINSPRGILREAINTRLISEADGAQCMKMVESRNRTSHIYHHEVAEDVAAKIPNYYDLMVSIVATLQSNVGAV